MLLTLSLTETCRCRTGTRTTKMSNAIYTNVNLNYLCSLALVEAESSPWAVGLRHGPGEGGQGQDGQQQAHGGGDVLLRRRAGAD